jgi:DNA-binding transcriptional LysR family regulator
VSTGPDLRQLRYVIEVARQGSFTRAAEQLHVAQQALSQQVKAVEEQVGVRLFERGNRGVETTPAGSVFVQEARKVVSGVERVVARTQAASRGEAGSLRIAYTLSTAYETLPALIAEVRDDVPDVRIAQVEMLAADLVAALLEGRQDLALCPRMVVPASIERLELRREPFVAAVGDRHPLAGRDRIGLRELADDEFQLWPRDVAPGYYDAVLAACRAAGFEPRLGDAASGATIWGAIAAGQGVGLVIGSLWEQLPRGITLVALTPPVPRLIFDLLWSKDHDTPVTRRARGAAAALAHAVAGPSDPWSRGARRATARPAVGSAPFPG